MEDHDLAKSSQYKSSNKGEEAQKLEETITDQINHLDMPDRSKRHIISAMQMYSGLIPHPKILEGYQKLYPKAGERIIENGIAESEQRRALEAKRQKRRGRMAWVSLVSLIIILAAVLLGSFFLIMNGHKIIGTFFGSVSFLSLLGTLLGYVDKLSSNDDLTREEDHNKEPKA